MAENKELSHSIPLVYSALLCTVVTGMSLLFIMGAGSNPLHGNTAPLCYPISKGLYEKDTAIPPQASDTQKVLNASTRVKTPNQTAGAFLLREGARKKNQVSLAPVSPYDHLHASANGSLKFNGNRNRQCIYRPIIARAARQYSIDPALVQAIIFAESAYNPNAVSKKGAMGLMQLMPGTAKAMGVEDCFNPEHNIFGGVRYFKKLTNQFNGNTVLALAAYNAGGRHVRNFNGVPPFKATQYYVKKVLKYYEIYKNQQVR